jgi:hypothetical protein
MRIYIGSGQNNGNTEKLRNRICVGYVEKTYDGNNVLPFVYICNAPVSAVVIASSDSRVK